MPGVDKPTGRVVALIVLLIVVAAALRGYLPVHAGSSRSELIGDRAAMMFVIAALTVTVVLVAAAVIARLRDPVAVAPHTGELSDMVGAGGGRPNWRVLLIGFAVILAWLMIAILLAQLFGQHGPSAVTPTPDPTTSPSASGTPSPPKSPGSPNRNPASGSGSMFEILVAGTVPLLLIIVTGAVVMSRRRRLAARAAMGGDEADDYVEAPVPPPASASLMRAAELGLAEMTDLSREPREAIIACYAAMERELANVPGAMPQDFDTATEVLARAVEHHALHVDNAVQLVNLFTEARFSPHVMNEGHREEAARVLRLVLDELAPRTGSRSGA
jgi:Domain of unknown function (DUF4129)